MHWDIASVFRCTTLKDKVIYLLAHWGCAGHKPQRCEAATGEKSFSLHLQFAQ